MLAGCLLEIVDGEREHQFTHQFGDGFVGWCCEMFGRRRMRIFWEISVARSLEVASDFNPKAGTCARCLSGSTPEDPS